MGKKIEAPTIETKRLILRARKEKDIPDMLEYFTDEDVRKYLGGYPPKDEHSMLKIIRHRKQTEWAAVLKETNKVIGECHFNKIVDGYLGEVGYLYNKNYWGKGYASESVREIINYGFNVLKIKRISATIDNQNNRSIAFIERLGFEYVTLIPEADFGGRVADIAYYTKINT